MAGAVHGSAISCVIFDTTRSFGKAPAASVLPAPPSFSFRLYLHLLTQAILASSRSSCCSSAHLLSHCIFCCFLFLELCHDSDPLCFLAPTISRDAHKKEAVERERPKFGEYKFHSYSFCAPSVYVVHRFYEVRIVYIALLTPNLPTCFQTQSQRSRRCGLDLVPRVETPVSRTPTLRPERHAKIKNRKPNTKPCFTLSSILSSGVSGHAFVRITERCSGSKEGKAIEQAVQ